VKILEVTMSLLNLTNLVAVVSGAGSGIGLATTEALLAEGARVAALDLAPPPARDGLLPLVCDVTDQAAIDRAVAAAIAHFGGIDLLINNAGIGAQGTVEDNEIAEWQRVFDVNVFAMVRLSRACLPHLRKSSHAAIVNTASIVSWTGLVKRACYGASKGAVYALTLAMAADHLADRIRVNCVCPGTIDTPWVGRLLAAAPDPGGARANLVARQPIGRLGTAEEVAAAICYLASPASGYTTGTALQIDGGTHSVVVPRP
jgi:NAD(P)-dependent dehydrogenase (short-subunit alcohol dehydrogenase family)